MKRGAGAGLARQGRPVQGYFEPVGAQQVADAEAQGDPLHLGVAGIVGDVERQLKRLAGVGLGQGKGQVRPVVRDRRRLRWRV